MGKVLISPNYMTGIADAVRQKLGISDKLTAVEIAEKISDMVGELSLDVIAKGYSSARQYSVGDYVIDQGKLYVCTRVPQTGAPIDTTAWRATTIAEELSSILTAGVADDQYY